MTPKRAPGALVPQPHGGALRRGNPGNRGRAASAIRAGVLNDAPAAHAFLVAVMQGKPSIEERHYCNACDAETTQKVSAPVGERLRAATEILRYGLGPAAGDVADLERRVREVLGKQLAYLEERLREPEPELYREVMLRLSELWSALEQR